MAENATVTIPVREMQNTLVALGQDIGPTGADNVWGPRTEAAYIAAAQAAGISGADAAFSVSDRRQLELNAQTWMTLRGLAAGSGPGTPPGVIVPPGVPAPDVQLPTTALVSKNFFKALPTWAWILFGGGVLAAGGLVIYKLRK